MFDLTPRDLTYLISALDHRIEVAGDDETASLRRVRDRAECALADEVAAIVELDQLVKL